MSADKAKMISVGELFGQSWSAYKKVFKRAIGLQLLALLSFVPLIIVLVAYAILQVFINSGGGVIVLANVLLGFVGLASVVVIIFLTNIAYFGAYYVVANYGKHITFKEALAYGKKNFWSFLWLNVLLGILILLWMLLLIIPAIIMGIFYSFALWFFVEENAQGMVAIRQSKELVKGYWWPVFGRTLLLVVFTWVILAILGTIINDKSTEQRTYSGVSQLVSIFITPFTMAYSHSMYKNLRSIKNQPKI